MYLLLRNNKQSGPYALEELKTMGLKAYDLVWSEGKSAAWRYPCELEELKSFAPPVDEQPFDRFYKKPSAAAASNAAAGNISPGNTTSTGPVPVTVESTRNPGKRIIYVTMPAARNSSSPAIQREPVRDSIRPVYESARPAAIVPPTAVAQQAPTIIQAPTIQPTPIVQQAPDEPAPEYSPRPENSPRPEYSSRPMNTRVTANKTRPLQLLLVGGCILTLLAAGIFIGINLNKNTLAFPGRVVAKIPPTTDQPDPRSTAQSQPASAATSPAVAPDASKTNDSLAAIDKKAAGPLQQANGKRVAKLPGAKTQKEKSTRPINPVNLPVTKDSAAGPSDVTRAVRQTDVIETRNKNNGTSMGNPESTDKEAMKTALANQVSVGANGYSVGTFGGINDLQLTVTNRSVYPLDLVIVEVQYIQANKKVFKTENLYFHGISAGSALMQEAPKSSRGVKVQYRITAISSKELGLSYSGI